MVLNHRDYEKSIKNLINDKIKFKDLSDVTIEQESKLQRSLTTLKSYVWSMKNMKNMKKNYPSGSSPAKNLWVT